ncbi:spore germination protein [Paenibacillus sp. UNC451MF]|uniref:spore germination protein n=1 Tax=Paenibacillus sp. UNC451MF TaxID=1449063 RepID=UPI00048BD0E0|nr:spore germination protein [Paenibacillus sp. UNC451MF]
MLKSGRRRQPPADTPNQEQRLISPDLAANIDVITFLYEDCTDIIFHPFKIGGATDAFLVYIDDMSDTELIDQQVLTPLLQAMPSELTISELKSRIRVSDSQEVTNYNDAVDQISRGNAVVFIDRINSAFSLGLAKWEKRSIEEPIAESVVRGPRLGFTETMGVNTSMLRRIIRSPSLKMKSLTIGRYTRTEVMVTYIKGIADPALIDEICHRLQRIDIDGILDSAYIEELINDNPYTPFPTMLSTERPDVVSANLLEGRVGIIIDGSPFVLVAPVTMFSLLQSPEDYYHTYWAGSMIRWLRYLYFLVALTIPSAYVAILTYHQEMIPTTLLLSVAKSREEIPFPALIEALLMEVTFEALREAGLRLPKQVGAAVSIVGALVIGQAAISAGLVSSPMVMVVAFTGVASFTFPRYTLGITVRLLRFPLMFLAGFLGLLGLMLGIIMIVIHLCTLRSFGVPYLSPIAPMKQRAFKDVFLRTPIWSRATRPHFNEFYNEKRQSPDMKPKPPES